LFNAHFSWVEEQAADNVAEALAFLSTVTDGPALLVGDFNQTPDAPVLKPLVEAGWVDAWAQLCPGEAGHTFESNNPTIRIDYAWANPALAPALESIEIVGRAQDASGYRVSDHHGLLVKLGQERWALT
jgi:endonuclease/exonuclease/phosphatase family metal-dependent hydrolase